MSQHDQFDSPKTPELLAMVDRAAAGTLTRRGFVTLAAAIGAGQLAASQLGPLRRAFGAGEPRPPVPGGSAGAGNLVVVYLGGGNDGLNTLVPVTDPEYHRLRPSIKLMPEEVLSLGSGVALGLHPMLTNLQRRYLAGQVALITGVGYNVPDLSHFNSLDHWEAGYGALGSGIYPAQSGWIGRWLDGIGAGPFAATSFRSDDKTALGVSTDPIRLRPWDSDLVGAPTTNAMEILAVDALRTLTNKTGLGSYADGLGSVLGSALAAGQQVGPAIRNIPNATSFIGRQMVIAGRLLNAGIGARVVTAVHGGFDTHNEQAIRGANGNAYGWHGKLLSELDVALELLFSTMTDSVRANTTVLVYSEFGRRVGENGSFGTDHGQAGVAMVLGEGVNGGIFGEQPSLTDLQDGNVKMNVDFRSVYATLLSRFLGADDSAIIGASHQRLLLSKADAQAATSSTTTSTSTSTSTTSSLVTTTVATTAVPTTAAPTTAAPTTAAPTTAVGTTQVGSTSVDTTAVDTTAVATTQAPTTQAPTTAAPTTQAPTTAAPTTMLAPTTLAPQSSTTVRPSSTTSSTLLPSTSVPKFDPPVIVTPTPGPGLPSDPPPQPAPLPFTPPLTPSVSASESVPFDAPVEEVPTTVAPTPAPSSLPSSAVTPTTRVGTRPTTLPSRLALKPKPKPKAKAKPTIPKKKTAKKPKPKSIPSSIAKVLRKKA
jgi:uncharacterized protein (DUF1501 family)